MSTLSLAGKQAAFHEIDPPVRPCAGNQPTDVKNLETSGKLKEFADGQAAQSEGIRRRCRRLRCISPALETQHPA